jgi:predicted negative regulator of RcsB-dependent stress response
LAILLGRQLVTKNNLRTNFKTMSKKVKIILGIVIGIILVITAFVAYLIYSVRHLDKNDPRVQQMLQNVDKKNPGVVANSSVNIALIPMYGGFQKTLEQIKGDEEFINEVLKKYKTKEEASVAFVGFARNFFEKGDLDMAMKRFNDAWLFNDKNPDVFVGFGDILKKRGQDKEATDMYAKAEELKK